MTDKHYTLVDICWTLFYSNTTFDFLDFAVKDAGYRRLRRFGSTWFGKRLNLLLYKMFHYDWLRARCVHYLTGYTQQQLYDLAEQFYRSYLLPRQIPEIWNRMPESGIVLVSGTLDIIARTVAHQIGAEAYYATEMIYKDNVFTGKIRDLLLTKSSALPQYGDYNIITDNLTDIDLVRKARQATIILYNNRPRWDALLSTYANITYIEAARQRY